MSMDDFPCPFDAPEQECLIAPIVNFPLVSFDQRFDLDVCNGPGEIAFDVRLNI